MIPLLSGLAAFTSTLLGGLFAIRFRRYLTYILGFTGGVVLGVVAFDVVPEIFKTSAEIHADSSWAMVALVAAFLVFHLSEKLVSAHHSHDVEPASHIKPKVGVLSAGGLVGHSFLDGVGIGLAYHVSAAIGLTVTLAIVAHDFSDGLNTVSLMLAHGNKLRHTLMMLVAGALAPVLGVLMTYLVHVSEYGLTLYLGVFAGFLLYVSAGSILPEAHRERFSLAIFALTVAGAAFMYVVTRLAA